MTDYNRFDTTLADGCYVRFERAEREDSDSDPRDWMDETDDAERIKAWENGEWSLMGIQAMAHCEIVRGGVGTYYTLMSAGVWGIESDSGEEYLEGVYQGEVDQLKADIEAMNAPIYS